MSKLVYITNTSLDGYVEDETGAFDWVIPERESEHDISIGGAERAGLALEADLVDECQLFLNPVIVGGGKPAFRAALRRNLEFLETRRFGTGVIHWRYRIQGGA
jgi:dihydrofolate reductase